ncbi:hypothetical protein H6G80_35945 [Nostoc sp. FACHB-87]|uniref:hypothetical protein n=1 Tax=Nostocaceae TaxID=1162 RepID=UPI00168718F8|nr:MULTISPECIES: hypothetical protein [Nostocaceae]MBD2459403.1 hypothetical protein [Nostoc sp. FACHB-87]MBD2480390.1 hypothetical protein [Anabaena sp. FACHB-83]
MSDLELQLQMQMNVQRMLSNFPDDETYIIFVLKYFEFLINFPAGSLTRRKLCELIVDFILYNYDPEEYSMAIEQLQAAIEYAYS